MDPTLTAPATSRFVTAGGLRLHYHEAGTGFPLICLHGAGPGANAWGNFQHNVGAFAQQFRTLLLDMPQFGESDKVLITEGRSTFNARVLRDFMDALGIERAHFVGNSMGGQAAIKLAIDYPDRIERLAVIGSTPVSQSLFCPMPLEGIKMIVNYYRGEGPTLEKMRALVQTLVYDASVVPEEAIRERYEASLDPDVIQIMAAAPPAREDLGDQLHRVACPALIVWGLEDRFGALDIGLMLARRFQNARMHIFAGCGHWAQVERADEFNRLVLDFLVA